MTVEANPFGIQADTYSAEITRRATMGAFLRRGATIGSIAGGLVASSDSQITIGSGLHVEVGTGEILVPGSSSATQSGYYLRVSAAETLALAAADPSNPRVDRISAIIKDAAYTGAENLGTLAVETGTPTSGANLTNLSGVAAAPTSSYTLGYALVPAGASAPSEVKNVSERLVPGLSTATYREGTAAARPTFGVPGRIYHATDTNVTYMDTGSAWIGAWANYQEGTAAERPAAGVKGRVYRATDTSSVSVDTGSEWKEIGGGGEWTAVEGLSAKLELIGVVQTLRARTVAGVNAQLRGGVKVKTGETIFSEETLFTLPAAFRPPGRVVIPRNLIAGVNSFVKIETSGAVKILGELKTGQAEAYFDGLVWNLN